MDFLQRDGRVYNSMLGTHIWGTTILDGPSQTPLGGRFHTCGQYSIDPGGNPLALGSDIGNPATAVWVVPLVTCPWQSPSDDF